MQPSHSSSPDNSISSQPTAFPDREDMPPAAPRAAADTSRTLSSQDTAGGAGSPSSAGALSLDIERKVFAERFDLLEELGSGGMGRVLKAFDRKLQRAVAVKRIKGPLATDPDLLRRFLREAQFAARLNHPNVVTVHDILTDDEGPYLVLEFIDGESLADRLQRSGAIPWREAIDLLLPICDAVKAAHSQKVIHRDIKPANILLPKKGPPKLADFGIARSLDGSDLTASGVVLGTLDYMAPEQMDATKTVDERADVYSLAATLYHMVTGASPRHLELSDTPESLVIPLQHALNPKWNFRTKTVSELAASLKSIDRQKGISTHNLRLRFKYVEERRNVINSLYAEDPLDFLGTVNELAEDGNAESQYQLGVMYDHGLIVTKDQSKASRWFELAAIQGHAKAQNRMGILSNIAVESRQWFSKAAATDCSDAQFNLGLAYEHGYGVSVNEALSLVWYRKAAKLGDLDAMRIVADNLTKGQIVQSNETEAIEWYKRIAEKTGKFSDKIDAGKMLASRSLQESERWFFEAAQIDPERAYNVLADMNRSGDALPVSLDKAMTWLREAARGGDASLKYRVGCMLRDGEGLIANPNEALKWFLEAARKGHAHSQYDLGCMYREGEGVRLNHSKSIRWFRLAAKQGHPHAQLALASLLLDEKRTSEAGSQEAAYWFERVLRNSMADREMKSEAADACRRFLD